jgi:hypothetical protein
METFQHPQLTEPTVPKRADALKAGDHIIVAGGHKITAVTQVEHRKGGFYFSTMVIHTLDHRGYALSYSTTPSRIFEVVEK